MAVKEFYIGTAGPFIYDDEQVYSDGVPVGALRFDEIVAPTAEEGQTIEFGADKKGRLVSPFVAPEGVIPVGKKLQSSNYVAETAGFLLNGDGTYELNVDNDTRITVYLDDGIPKFAIEIGGFNILTEEGFKFLSSLVSITQDPEKGIRWIREDDPTKVAYITGVHDPNIGNRPYVFIEGQEFVLEVDNGVIYLQHIDSKKRAGIGVSSDGSLSLLVGQVDARIQFQTLARFYWNKGNEGDVLVRQGDGEWLPTSASSLGLPEPTIEGAFAVVSTGSWVIGHPSGLRMNTLGELYSLRVRAGEYIQFKRSSTTEFVSLLGFPADVFTIGDITAPLAFKGFGDPTYNNQALWHGGNMGIAPITNGIMRYDSNGKWYGTGAIGIDDAGVTGIFMNPNAVMVYPDASEILRVMIGAVGDTVYLGHVGKTVQVNATSFKKGSSNVLTDADINPDDYYTKVEQQTAGQAELHWNNIISKPNALYRITFFSFIGSDIISFVPTSSGVVVHVDLLQYAELTGFTQARIGCLADNAHGSVDVRVIVQYWTGSIWSSLGNSVGTPYVQALSAGPHIGPWATINKGNSLLRLFSTDVEDIGLSLDLLNVYIECR